MLRSVVPANPAAFLNKSDSQRKRFGGYIPIGKSPEHGFIFFLLFLFKSGGSNGIHRLRNQSVMFQCAFKQNAGRTVNRCGLLFSLRKLSVQVCNIHGKCVK